MKELEVANHRLNLFEDITSLMRDTQLTLTNLMDKQSTAKERRAIGRVQKKLLAWESQDLRLLKKNLLAVK
jgi:hypothetical protein